MKKRWSAVGVLVAMFLSTACTAQESSPQAGPVTSTIVEPRGDHMLCDDHVVVYFKTDDDMRAGVAALASTDRLRGVYTQTKEEAFAFFQEAYAEQPEKAELARVEIMPAVAQVLPEAGVDVTALAADFRTLYPAATRIEPFVPPADEPEVEECPADGLWPPR
ncbi:hypothetical protein ACRAKI_29595 [Saccharothrix isguenensis]